MACYFDVIRNPGPTTYATCSLSLNSPSGGYHDTVIFSFDNCEQFSGNYDYEARPPIYFADNYDRNNRFAPPLASWSVCTKVDPSGNQPGAHYTYTTDEGYVGATWEFGEGVITFPLRPSFDLFGGSGTNLHTYAGDQRGGYEEFEVYNAPDIQSWLLPYKWNEAYFVVHYTPPRAIGWTIATHRKFFCTSNENVRFIHTSKRI